MYIYFMAICSCCCYRKTEQGLTDIDDGIDWGCFPLCLPMEEMIKNLVER